MQRGERRGCLGLVNHRAVLWLLVAGSVGVMVYAVNRSRVEPVEEPLPVVHAHERPWITDAAIDEVLGEGGGPGALFSDVAFGSTPTAMTRARIEQFAKTNDVEIRLETKADQVTAIRFAVTYGGCCGYEGADRLGRRLGRPWTEDGCPAPKEWVNTWTFQGSDTTLTRVHVAVNRVEIRWEPLLSVPQLLERMEKLVGQPAASVADEFGDHWRELEVDHRYLLEVPFLFGFKNYIFSEPPKLAQRDDLGIMVTIERGVITGVKITIQDMSDFDPLREGLEKRWGHPRMRVEGETSAPTWRWKKPGLSIVANPEDATRTVEIKRT